MAAPAAPVIHVKQDGVRVYVRWKPVTSATSYKVYADGVLGATVLAAALNADGYFSTVLANQSGPVVVTATALNVGDEESAASNSVRKEVFTRGG